MSFLINILAFEFTLDRSFSDFPVVFLSVKKITTTQKLQKIQKKGTSKLLRHTNLEKSTLDY